MGVSRGSEIPAQEIMFLQQHNGGFINAGDEEQLAGFGDFSQTTQYFHAPEYFPVSHEFEPGMNMFSEDPFQLLADSEQCHIPNAILEGSHVAVSQENLSEENIQPECFANGINAGFEKWQYGGTRKCWKSEGRYSNKAMFKWIIKQWRNELNKGVPFMSASPTPQQDIQLHSLKREQTPPRSPLVQNAREEHVRKASYNHMLAERLRRQKEKQLKSALVSLIPPEIMKKKDKNSVFQYTIDYIKFLKSQLQDESSSMTTIATKFDEEVSKSSESILIPTNGNMMVQGDGKFIKFCFDTSNRDRQANMLMNVLTCARTLGFEVDSIQWRPESSPMLSLTVHATESLISGSQLGEALQKSMFISQEEEADVRHE